MAAIDGSIYYLIYPGIILFILYVIPYFNYRVVSTKLSVLLPGWLTGIPRKDEFPKRPVFLEEVETEAPISTCKSSLSWWTDEEIFQLERRAVFSKTWLFITHASNFRNPGDYRTFDIVGFSFIVILGKDRQLRAFHNVCRHRAYAVTKKESGSTTVLRCRYHGWSYDCRGRLIKAPEFENVKGFEKNLNGLWELRTEVRESMIFVNFDTGNETTSQVLGSVQADLRRWGVGEMELIEEWIFEGFFNWKLGMGSLSSGSSDRRFQWFTFGAAEEYLTIFNTTIFRRLSSGQVLCIKPTPLSKNTSKVEYSLYGAVNRSTKATRQRIESLKLEIQFEIRQLELQQNRLVQDNLDLPDSQLSHLRRLGTLLKQHREAESRLGTEIHPTAQKQSFTPDGREDDDLCREIENEFSRAASFCSAEAKGLLDW